MQAKGRLQPWNSKGWRPEGLVEAAARDVQAKGRLQPWNSKGCRPEGLVAAAARKQCSSWRWKLPRGSWRVLRVLSVWSLANGRLECPNKRGLCAGKGQAAMLERWRPRAWWKLPRGMCRKRAGCKPGTAKADGQRAWWKLPPGSWRVLRVLSVWSLANGRLECPNKRGLCAGKGQAATLEQQRLTAGLNALTRPEGLVEAAARDVQAKGRLQPWNSKGCRPEGLVAAAARKQCSSWRWKLPRGSWRVLRVLSVWSLANGRLECPNKRGLCAGKGQAAMLERWRPGAWCAARDVQAKGRLQPWNSKGWRPEGLVEAAARKLEGFKGFKRLKPGKRQAWMP